MAIQPDINVFDSTGRQVLVVEVKNKRNTDAEWAAGYRRNLLAHEPNWGGQYFLVATPDRLYLWDQRAGTEPGAPPSKIIEAAPLLEPLFDRFHVDPERVSGQTFEILVGELISNLFLARGSEAQALDALDSDLVSAVRDGRLSYPAAA